MKKMFYFAFLIRDALRHELSRTHYHSLMRVIDPVVFESEKRGEVVTPRFESTSTDFFLILPNLNYGRVINGVDSSSEGVNSDVGTNARGKTTPQVTTQKTAQKILELMRNHPQITRDVLAKQCEISSDGVKWQLNNLKSKGKIRRIGPDKGGHWEVIDEAAEGK